MIDQSDPGVAPKARARKKAAMPPTEPTPPPRPIRTGIDRPQGNATLWAMFAGACLVILILLGLLANRPGPVPADSVQTAAIPDSSRQVVTYGAEGGGGTYVNGPLPQNANGATYAPGAASPGAAGAAGGAGTTAPGSVGNAGAVAMTGTTGGVSTGAAGARGPSAPGGGAFGPGSTPAGGSAAAGGATGAAGSGPGGAGAGGAGAGGPG